MALFEQKLFEQNSIETEEKTLLKIANKSFSELINELKPSKVIGFSTKGKKQSLEEVASKITPDSCIVIGGFQKGHFSKEVLIHQAPSSGCGQHCVTRLYPILVL